MTKPLVAALAAALLLALPGAAQTASELLQKGIYAQETEGNLDDAILIYRQIVNSAPAQREIAAQAQYRLAQALLQKGDLATASKEFERLARDYSDYGNLVSSLAGQIRPVPAGGRGGRGPTPAQSAADQLRAQAMLARTAAALAELRAKSGEGHPDVVVLERQLQDLKKAIAETPTAGVPALWHPDPNKPVTIQGKVAKVEWINPRVIIDIPVTSADGTATLWGLQLGAPNTLLKLGWTRATLKLGETVTVVGYLAKEDAGAADVKSMVPTSMTLSDGRTLPSGSQQD